jgi:hypothetical protein
MLAFPFREEHILKVFEIRVLRIFGPRVEEVTGGCEISMF